MLPSVSRRRLLAAVPWAAAAAIASGSLSAAGPTPEEGRRTARPKGEPFGYCLNSATLRGQKLKLAEVVEIAAKAGYEAIEPWIDEMRKHQEAGGSLDDLRKRIADLGLTVESAIGFAPWLVDDDSQRAKGLEAMKRDMELVARLGGRRIAAPPAGATNQANLDLRKAAERYRTLLELGAKEGVTPQLELWGFSQALARLGEVWYVAVESHHPQACVLLDVYHLYKGGSGFDGISLLGGKAMHVIHMNDYPADPPREKISDEHRVFPGDGVAPLAPLFRNLSGIGFTGFLSLELFNKDYWSRDGLTVARTGLEKMKLAVRAAFSSEK